MSLPRERFDLLRAPVAGPFLRWRGGRTTLQAATLIVALVMIVHGFFGPSLAPKNLASLLTWVHFRGLVVLVILVGGNFFCMACPFTLVRDLARRWIRPRWKWPALLRTKWSAAVLFAAVLFVYEWKSLWSNPWATALLLAGYFGAACAVDLLFRKASFCKYLCPIGQFNFLSSTLSPLEVGVRDPGVCAGCRTRDCIAGRREPAPALRPAQRPLVQRGCELDLFLPQKVGNLDCTFCLDCVHACPHDNVGLLARLPGEELAVDAPRSGIGVLQRRGDWTGLIVVFVFGAVLNAFAMTSPAYALERALGRLAGTVERGPVIGLLFALALVAEPAVLLFGAAWITRQATGTGDTLAAVVNRHARALVPLGFGIWLAHYGFHFLTGALTVVPVTQYAALSATGHALFGAPQWGLAGIPAAYVYPIELGFMAVGLLGTLAVAWTIARAEKADRPAAGFAPWAALALALFAAAAWTMSQPMDMRGTFLTG